MSDTRLQTILLIDDNPNDRLLVQRELNREFAGLTIYDIIDQQQFDSALANANFDFVITDFQLGWSDGLKTLSTIKKRFPECPVIMFTNTGTQEIAVAAMKSGLDDYVIKSPQHFVRLRQAVRSVWQTSQTKRKANELEQRLQALLNQLDIGIFRAGQTGQLLDANIATLNMLGVASLQEAQALLGQQLAATDRANRISYTSEIELRLPDADAEQSSLWLKIIATPSQVGGDVIIDGLIEDITARKQAEEALNHINQTLEIQIQQRTEQLARTNEELGMFTYSVSHDLRTPIRQINGFVAFLKEALDESKLAQSDRTSFETNQQIEHYLTVLSNASSQAGSMIDALLAFSQTGRAEMVYEPVEMDQVVQALIDQATDSLSGRNVRWEVSALPSIMCDRSLIVTVWQNLIDNALKFTRDCSKTHIQIGAKVKPQQTETIFFIKDNGIGFNATQANRIFGMFQQAHSADIAAGTGIGLASARRIITRHKGKIWAEGNPHEGAAFYFSLPNTFPV